MARPAGVRGKKMKGVCRGGGGVGMGGKEKGCWKGGWGVGGGEGNQAQPAQQLQLGWE